MVDTISNGRMGTLIELPLFELRKWINKKHTYIFLWSAVTHPRQNLYVDVGNLWLYTTLSVHTPRRCYNWYIYIYIYICIYHNRQFISFIKSILTQKLPLWLRFNRVNCIWTACFNLYIHNIYIANIPHALWRGGFYPQGHVIWKTFSFHTTMIFA